jgi:hypothetical protein
MLDTFENKLLLIHTIEIHNCEDVFCIMPLFNTYFE